MRQYNKGDRHSSSLMGFTVATVTLAIALVAAEYGLRACGYRPAKQFFRPVDRLEVYDHFVTDANGIFKANLASTNWAGKASINAQGFRGPAFEPKDGTRRSVLILGDSYVWGLSAQPLTRSFPDLLRAHGCNVYNTGIPGTGPTQYERIARRYIPKLQPEIVLVAITMENDLLALPQDVAPHQNLWHITNAGWIFGLDEAGNHLSANEAYDHYIGGAYASAKRIAYSSALGTLFITAAKAVRKRLRGSTTVEGQSAVPSRFDGSVADRPYAYTFDLLERVARFARLHGAEFAVLVIPDHGEGCGVGAETGIEPFRAAFDALGAIHLDDIPADVYTPHPDCHVTNRGHRFIAERLLASFESCDSVSTRADPSSR